MSLMFFLVKGFRYDFLFSLLLVRFEEDIIKKYSKLGRN